MASVKLVSLKIKNLNLELNVKMHNFFKVQKNLVLKYKKLRNINFSEKTNINQKDVMSIYH